MLKSATPLSPVKVHPDSKVGPLALTFDDVLVVPRYSEIAPTATDTRTRLARAEHPE